MSICLCMIVKNEEAIIERCLDSVLGLADRFVIVDTGSTDATREVIGNWSVAHDLPGELHEREWVDFGHNRTELMALAWGKADYLLLLDADHTVTVDQPFTSKWLTADAYMLRHADDPEYWIKRLVRGDRTWRYVGATHEYITGTGGETVEDLGAITIHHHLDGGTRHEKFERDERLLRQELAREPGNPRTAFYLANTLRDLGRHEEAIEWYEQRSRMGGWVEEVYVSLLEMGRLGDDIAALLAAYDRIPTRAEALYELAWRFRQRKMHQLALMVCERGLGLPVPAHGLFVRRWVYEWAMEFEYSIAAYYAGQPVEALEACDRLLANPQLPLPYREQTERNRAFCEAAVAHR